GDPFGSPLVQQPRGGNGDAVEQAEAHRLRWRRVVAGRTNNTVRVPQGAAADAIDRLHHGADSSHSGLPRGRGDAGVEVDAATAAGDQLADVGDVFAGMDELECGVVDR